METATTYELKRTGVGPWLSLVLLNIRNFFCSWTFFLSSWGLGILNMFASAAVFYLMGEFVGEGAADRISEYATSYGPYIVVGLMVNMLLRSTMNSFHEACLYGYWATQFDTYISHPGGVSAYFTGNLLSRYAIVILNTAIYLLVGVILLSVSVKVANLPDVCVILIVGVLAVAGLGLAGASTFSLLNARQWGTNPVEWIVNFAVTLLAGVYFPPSVLPRWLADLSEWLPHTHILRSARLCLGGMGDLADPRVTSDLFFLLKFAAVALPAGLALFLLGMRKAEKDGTLSRWT